MNTSLLAARVRVPCSTSNLGAGFDCIGLALDRYLDVEFEPATSGGLHVERAGTLAPLGPAGADDAAAAAFLGALETRGLTGVHGRLILTSDIPVARGLGSSAAATVAGLVLASAVLSESPDRPALVAEAARIEGHPDNAAPALLGGLVAVVVMEDGELRPFPLPLSNRIAFAFASPSISVSTVAARRVLPASVGYGDAVRSLGRVAALVHGLATGDPDLLRAGFTDELHVPFRLPLIPGAAAAIEAGRAAGAWAVTISGSGSGLIAACSPNRQDGVLAAMTSAFRSAGGAGPGAVAIALRPDTGGARILSPALP